MDKTMDGEKSLSLLGLQAGASAVDVEAAYSAKQQQVSNLLEKAPTEGLKAKYQQMLEPLAQARDLLLASASDASSEKEAATPGRGGLSQSKFEDLPNASARHSQFEEKATAELSLQEGQLLAGRYKIEEKIAAGGMGVVYRAFDQNRNEDIAIKVMLPSLVKNPRAREKFMDEARLSSKLTHANIVNVFDVQNDSELFFITMELLEGQDLRDVMENRKLARSAFTKEEVLELLAHIVAGLNHAHQVPCTVI